MERSNIFHNLETITNEKIDPDVIKILIECGYDTRAAWLGLNHGCLDTFITDIEQYTNDNRTVLEGTSYENIATFKLKPGHKSILFRLADQMKLLDKADDINKKPCDVINFSTILRAFIETAETNMGKDPRGFRYSEINLFFSMFVYLHCGRACFDTLSANLPIPSGQTIRKFFDNYRVSKCRNHFN